jgi:radical SAM superfamily enzyme YgiQ (UPF0313 family)
VKVTLIYPPFSDARAPQLGLPQLAAYLRAHGVTVELQDANADAVWWLARSAELGNLRARLERRSQSARPGTEHALCDALIAEQRAEWALAVLRDRSSFFDPHQHAAARAVIDGLLRAAGAACDVPVEIGFNPIRYDAEGVDATRLKDLLRATSDDSANVYASFYREDVLPRLQRGRPDLVGISLTNRQQLLPGLILARHARAAGHFVVLGGALISKFRDALAGLPEFFRHFADAVVCYEGEQACLALLDQLANGRRFEHVPNLLYLDGERVRVNPTHVENVDALPTPDFDGLPLDRYLAPQLVLPIMMGKGCYFNRCKFCDIPYINHVSPKPYRVRRAETVVADVRALEQRFGARHFVITDEALSPKLLVKLADALEPYRAEPRYFTGYARLEHGFTPEVLGRIHAMGVRKLFFGLESASQATIDHMDKGTDASAAARILRDCRSAGVLFHVFSIIGFPEESEARARETFQFFLDHQRTIEHPGNTFDIHPFGLELRAEYFRERERFGIQLRKGATPGELGIGVPSTSWLNSRGLSQERVQELLDQEFLPALARTYSTYHATRFHLWPGTEEYSVLYADRYGTHDDHRTDFPFVTSLPPLDSRLRFSIDWSPAVVERASAPGELELLLPGAALRIAEPQKRGLCARAPITARAYLQALPLPPETGDGARVEYVNALIRAGFLQVRTEPMATPPRGQTLAMFRKKQLLRLLCGREASALGVEPSGPELEQFITKFRADYALRDEAAFEGWLSAQGLDAPQFVEVMRELLIVELIGSLYATEMRAGMIEYIKVASALDHASRGLPTRTGTREA